MGIERATFAQMNLFRPALKNGFFDFVISNGVLHHTADCRGAFTRISRLAKPGGYVDRRPVQRIQPPGPLCPVGTLSAHWDHQPLARSALHQDRGQRKAPGVVSRPVLPSPRRPPHAERGNGLDGGGWSRVRQLDPQTGGWTALTPGEPMFAPKDPGTALGRILSQLAYMGSGYRRGRLPHRHRPPSAEGTEGNMISPRFPDEVPTRVPERTLPRIRRAVPARSSSGCSPVNWYRHQHAPNWRVGSPPPWPCSSALPGLMRPNSIRRYTCSRWR